MTGMTAMTATRCPGDIRCPGPRSVQQCGRDIPDCDNCLLFPCVVSYALADDMEGCKRAA